MANMFTFPDPFTSFIAASAFANVLNKYSWVIICVLIKAHLDVIVVWQIYSLHFSQRHWEPGVKEHCGPRSNKLFGSMQPYAWMFIPRVIVFLLHENAVFWSDFWNFKTFKWWLSKTPALAPVTRQIRPSPIKHLDSRRPQVMWNGLTSQAVMLSCTHGWKI